MLYSNFSSQLKELQDVRTIGQYILEELQLTPWALTSSYVNTHLKKDGTGMMRLSGVGDPSGIGEGFSFAQKPPETVSPVDSLPKNLQLDQLSIRKVTGTSADLRKLNMTELEKQLVDLGMERESVANLKRWDRVQMIIHMANLAVTYNTQDAASVSRFTRKPRKSTASEKKEYKHNIQEIWDRQVHALSLGPDEVKGYSEKIKSKPTSLPNKEIKNTNNRDEDLEDFQFEDLFAEVQSEEAANKEQQRMADLIRQAPTTSVEVAQRDEEKELNALKRNLAFEKNQNSSSGVQKEIRNKKNIQPALEYDERMKHLAKSLGSLCPRKVVKRIERKVQEDGTESINVRYDFDQERLRKLEISRSRRGIRPIDINQFPLAHFLPRANPSQNVIEYDSLDDEQVAQRAHKIKLSVMRKKVHEHQEFRKRKIEEERSAAKELYKIPRFGSSQRRVGGSRSKQPHNIFIEKLIGILDILIGRQDSGPFLRPISKTVESKAEWYPSYKSIIKHPMDLQTLKDHTQQFRYRNKEQFLNELKYIATNASDFNGPDHPLAISAANIVEDGRLQVESQAKVLDELVSKFEAANAISKGKVHRSENKAKNQDLKKIRKKDLPTASSISCKYSKIKSSNKLSNKKGGEFPIEFGQPMKKQEKNCKMNDNEIHRI
mmetsp:Transcript_1538/g.2322  ORF Transcript_1538/g.2322 Transcript_1538/m.2322 type:complete len:661 (+) Transcript_1538:17-1999(+)